MYEACRHVYTHTYNGDITIGYSDIKWICVWNACISIYILMFFTCSMIKKRFRDSWGRILHTGSKSKSPRLFHRPHWYSSNTRSWLCQLCWCHRGRVRKPRYLRAGDKCLHSESSLHIAKECIIVNGERTSERNTLTRCFSAVPLVLHLGLRFLWHLWKDQLNDQAII